MPTNYATRRNDHLFENQVNIQQDEYHHPESTTDMANRASAEKLSLWSLRRIAIQSAPWSTVSTLIHRYDSVVTWRWCYRKHCRGSWTRWAFSHGVERYAAATEGAAECYRSDKDVECVLELTSLKYNSPLRFYPMQIYALVATSGTELSHTGFRKDYIELATSLVGSCHGNIFFILFLI